MSLETVSLENESVSALNVADNADGIYIYLYTCLSCLNYWWHYLVVNQVYIFYWKIQ